MVLSNFYDRIQDKEIKISKDLYICTVIDKNSYPQSTLHHIKFREGNIDFLLVDSYKKWISKIETLYRKIVNDFDTLPNFILYIDGLDTLLLNSIENPSKFLDFYNCKVLFNIENQYGGTGYELPDPSYTIPWDDMIKNNLEFNTAKFGINKAFGLNAGVFLGHKEYLLHILKEAYEYMVGSTEQGFPFGCTDDQYVLRYIHNKYTEAISTDMFNRLAFWGGAISLTGRQEDELFSIGYTDQFLNNYKNT